MDEKAKTERFLNQYRALCKAYDRYLTVDSCDWVAVFKVSGSEDNFKQSSELATHGVDGVSGIEDYV